MFVRRTFHNHIYPKPIELVLSSGHMRISDFSFDGGTESVTKWQYNPFPGLIIGAFCTIFRAWPVYRGLGAKFGRKTAENRP